MFASTLLSESLEQASARPSLSVKDAARSLTQSKQIYMPNSIKVTLGIGQLGIGKLFSSMVDLNGCNLKVGVKKYTGATAAKRFTISCTYCKGRL